MTGLTDPNRALLAKLRRVLAVSPSLADELEARWAQTNALLDAARAEGRVSGADWRPIADRPTNEMFIWAKPGAVDGKWSVGLAYQNVSGGWSDAYGAPTAGATLCAPMPKPPA